MNTFFTTREHIAFRAFYPVLAALAGLQYFWWGYYLFLSPMWTLETVFQSTNSPSWPYVVSLHAGIPDFLSGVSRGSSTNFKSPLPRQHSSPPCSLTLRTLASLTPTDINSAPSLKSLVVSRWSLYLAGLYSFSQGLLSPCWSINQKTNFDSYIFFPFKMIINRNWPRCYNFSFPPAIIFK